MAGRKDREDWERLGSYVRRRRLEPGARERGRYFPDIRAFAAATGIHERTLGKLENGHSVGQNTLAAVEIALEWAPQSAKSILGGGEPREMASTSAKRSAGSPDLRDDAERKLWAIDELSEEDRWTYINFHRARNQQRLDSEHRQSG
jgi:hypothetical protein